MIHVVIRAWYGCYQKSSGINFMVGVAIPSESSPILIKGWWNLGIGNKDIGVKYLQFLGGTGD